MSFYKLWVIAYRDLGRNRRRSILTLVAIALGLALLILMSGFIAGTMEGSLQNSIRLKTSHLQLRAASYEEVKMSLLRRDLLENPADLAAAAAQMNQVSAASPVLWAGGILSTIQETVQLQVIGIDPISSLHDPIREGIVGGAFLNSDDRGQILIGQRLAQSMGIGVGQRVSLAVGSPEGEPVEGIFTVAGLFSTGIPGYDENTAFTTLSQAQSFTGVGERASVVRILLQDKDDAAVVAAALAAPGIKTLTWEELNSFLLESVQAGLSFYYIIYAIVILVVAVIIANTLLMAVFERTREMGVLAALGMKNRQIMLMFIFEAAILSIIGIGIGIILGSAGVAYLSRVGIFIGDSSSSVAENFAIGTTLFAEFVPSDVIALSIAMLVIILLASLYPARYAAKLEPVDALHAL